MSDAGGGSSIAERLESIRDRVAQAIERRGPGPEVTLIGVSKRHRIEAIREAYDAGLRDFGENYAQELDEKMGTVERADVRWHFIGALQSNKAKLVVGTHLIHTVDRISLLQALEKRAARNETMQSTLVEVNFEEAQKAGVSREQLPSLLDAFAATSHVRCEGLMIIPPTGTPEQTRPHFERLVRLREDLCQTTRPSVDLRHLSMGMSSDFEVAIEAGATHIRVGTAIFGARPS